MSFIETFQSIRNYLLIPFILLVLSISFEPKIVLKYLVSFEIMNLERNFIIKVEFFSVIIKRIWVKRWRKQINYKWLKKKFAKIV